MGRVLLEAWLPIRLRLLLAATLARRAAWRLQVAVRVRAGRADPGPPRRRSSPGQVSLPRAGTAPPRVQPAARVVEPRSDRVGILSSGRGTGMPAAGRLGEILGLHIVEVPPAAWAGVIERATSEHWPLIVLCPGAGPQSTGALSSLRHFVERGGEVLIVLEPEADVATVGRALAHELPTLRRARTLMGGLRFSSQDPELVSWFSGVAVSPVPVPWVLESRLGARALAWTGEGQADPILTMTRVGQGAVFTSVGPARLAGALRDQLSPEHWPAIVPALLLMRRLYAELVWHAPVAFANLTLDDPALTGGRLGLDYAQLVEDVAEAGYHLTVATIPRELGIADPSVLRLLQRRGDRLSACYHGWSHQGYEFSLQGTRRTRTGTPLLDGQERSIMRAAEAGRRFWHRTGVALDRVMVFPHGIAPAATLRALSRYGFLATCNFDEFDPLGAHPPADLDLGLRPADTAWAEVPLLWRRGVDDPRYLIDVGLGRPLLSFGHRRVVGPRLERFAGYAARVRAAAPAVRWAGLEDVARHAYLVRRDPVAGWQVLMTADSICLHNDSPSPRRYAIRRPHLPRHSGLSDGFVEVGPWQSREVFLNRTAASRLPRPTLTRPPRGFAPGPTNCSPSDGELIQPLQLEVSP